MARRRCKLPDYGALTKDQDKATKLDRDGQFLVIGGPGTGKSVVALWRTIRHQQNNDHLFLTYNHVLKTFTSQYAVSDINNDTAYSWFYKTYCAITGKLVPNLDNFRPDYDHIIRVYERAGVNNAADMHFVVDEGQDLPQGFYESLMALGYENFFIVADQNQQITEEHSSIQELIDMLGLNRAEVIELKENFRNTKEIAALSRHFYTDKASAQPELPENCTQEIPVLYEYDMVDNCVKMVLREADRDPDSLIGLIVTTEIKRKDYVHKLREMDIDRDHDKPSVSSYTASDKGNVGIDFSQGGIVVITDKSSKGVEFDTVFIVLDGLQLSAGDRNAMKKRLYVMTSRARKKLVLFKGASCDPAVSDLLPGDETILRREVL